MDKDNLQHPPSPPTDPTAGPSPAGQDRAHPLSVDMDGWVLTPAQRAFIQSFLSDDDSQA
ncbi:hypothetical protein [Erwinia persicina]|uniref:hypothetical protein n=1 Tax=Erwinia persicina TaxID=55211 RepID=UPI00178234AF|nr:hypothetical protein [Erwinia persicina]MBD8165145.1 hypothetical protein [Erwinia persicina]MBD8215968.1 hypothetical protein [Erwinia persicina]